MNNIRKRILSHPVNDMSESDYSEFVYIDKDMDSEGAISDNIGNYGIGGKSNGTDQNI